MFYSEKDPWTGSCIQVNGECGFTDQYIEDEVLKCRRPGYRHGQQVWLVMFLEGPDPNTFS